MKIGIDARMYRSSVAGIGRYSQNLIKNLLVLDKKNQYILFMTPADKKEFEKMKIENSLQIKNCKLKIIEIDIPHYSLSEQTKFSKVIKKEKLDLMHFLNFNYPVLHDGKFISVIHDLTLLFYPETARKNSILKRFAFKYIINQACQNSQKIITVSQNTKGDLIKVFNINKEKIKVIYEAADDKIFQKSSISDINKIKQRYAISDKPIILYVGQFRPHKNLKRLIDAFKILRRKQSLKLVLIGKIDKNSEINLLVDKYKYRRDILITGFVSNKELTSWYKIASVFVFPSLYEGFGLPGLEAMTAGTPVAASNRSSLTEIYQQAAIYFDPFNPSDIADKIKKVLIDKKLKASLIQKGYVQVKKYSWEKTAKETLNLYRQILTKS